MLMISLPFPRPELQRGFLVVLVVLVEVLDVVELVVELVLDDVLLVDEVEDEVELEELLVEELLVEELLVEEEDEDDEDELVLLDDDVVVFTFGPATSQCDWAMMMSPDPAIPLSVMCTAFTVMLEEPGALETCCSFRMTVMPAIGPIVVFGAGLASTVTDCPPGKTSAALARVVDPVEPELFEVQVLPITWAVRTPAKALTLATVAELVADPFSPRLP